jgi:hypothetical protein
MLKERAGRIGDARLRESFLGNVAVHREIEEAMKRGSERARGR